MFKPLGYDHSEPKVAADRNQELAYRRILDYLRKKGGPDGELIRIVFSTGIQVVVKREVAYEDFGYNNESDFDTFFIPPEPTEVKFREIERSRLSENDLLLAFNSQILNIDTHDWF